MPLLAFAEPPQVKPIAFIETTVPPPPDTKIGDIAKLEREGNDVPIDVEKGLLPGDAIVITRPGAVVIVRQLATNKVVAVGTEAIGPRYSVPNAAVPGLGSSLVSWFRGVWRGADQGVDNSAMVASRAVQGSCYNETGKTNEPIEFRIPILVASRSLIAAGDRQILVSWQGGAAPFSLMLSSTDTGATVAEMANIRGVCAVYLPRTELRPGRYRLTLTDAHSVKVQEDSLFVVKDTPAVPAELRGVNLPEEARNIYAATWLTAQARGTWAFEAQQRVAAMDCRSAAVQAWLQQWGGAPPCP